MKKSTLISLTALAVALVGVLIALAAYFHKKKETVLDDFDDELFYDDLDDDTEYYDAHLDDDCDCCCDCDGNCDDCEGCVEIESGEDDVIKF